MKNTTSPRETATQGEDGVSQTKFVEHAMKNKMNEIKKKVWGLFFQGDLFPPKNDKYIIFECIFF